MQNRQQKLSSLLKKARIERTGTLNLSNQDLNILDMPQICDFLNANPDIQHINLSSNYFGPEAAEMLANSVSILSLDISNNLLCDTGAIALSNMKTMKILNVAHNHLTDEALPALLGYFNCEVILENPLAHETHAIENITFRYDNGANAHTVPNGAFEHAEQQVNEIGNHIPGIEYQYDATGHVVKATFYNHQPHWLYTATRQAARYAATINLADSSHEENCTDIMLFKDGRTLVDKHIATLERGIIAEQDEQLADTLKSFKQKNKTRAYTGHNSGNPEQLTTNNYFTNEGVRVINSFNQFKNIATNNGKRLPSLLNCTLMFFNRNPQYARDEVPDELQKHLIAEPGARPAL